MHCAEVKRAGETPALRKATSWLVLSAADGRGKGGAFAECGGKACRDSTNERE